MVGSRPLPFEQLLGVALSGAQVALVEVQGLVIGGMGVDARHGDVAEVGAEPPEGGTRRRADIGRRLE